MAVKYVKDFAFDSGFGYTGSAGKTPVRGYNRGGKVFDNSTRNPISKFPELAPAMVGKGPGKMGGKTSDVAPMSTAKANPQIAKYAKGGKVKKPPMAKPMKAKMMKKAEGGPVAEITAGDGMSPLQEMAYAAPKELMGRYSEEYDRPQLPPQAELEQTPPELTPLKQYDMRPSGDRVDWFNLWTQKSKMSPERYDEYVKNMAPLSGMSEGDYRNYLSERSAANAAEIANRKVNVGPKPPAYGLLKTPPTVPLAGDEPRVPLAGDDGMVPGRVRAPEIDYENMRFSHMPLPSSPGLGVMEPIGAGTDVIPGKSLQDYASEYRLADQRNAEAQQELARKMGLDPNASTYFKPPGRSVSAPGPLARAATRRDNMMAARDIMDRYIAGDRNAMPRRSMVPGMRGIAESKARRAMPVAPREPMIQLPRAPQGGVMTYAKGGKVNKGEQKIGKVMGEYKRGELHSGSKKGPVVTNPKQAKAIALSEARAAGAKIPKKAMGGKACG